MEWAYDLSSPALLDILSSMKDSLGSTLGFLDVMCPGEGPHVARAWTALAGEQGGSVLVEGRKPPPRASKNVPAFQFWLQHYEELWHQWALLWEQGALCVPSAPRPPLPSKCDTSQGSFCWRQAGCPQNKQNQNQNSRFMIQVTCACFREQT